MKPKHRTKRSAPPRKKRPAAPAAEAPAPAAPPPPQTAPKPPRPPAAAAPAAKPSVSPDGTPQVKLKPHEDRRVRRGHLWVFSNEVETPPAGVSAGDVVHFLTSRDELLGVGYYNPHSLIAGRLLDRRLVKLDVEFFATRLRRALEMRETLIGEPAYRWVFGESDDLPGLVIDRFGETCVVESYAAGVDKLMPVLLEAMNAVHPWKAVVLRNEADARKLEHLPMSVEVTQGEVASPHWFESDGLKLAADLRTGQKTGFFFDQRDNRRAAAAVARGKRVLDVFCHTGGFGLWCAKAGAGRVTGVDASEAAVALAGEIAKANGFEGTMNFEKADAFQWLQAGKENFDLVVLDPPKFAASKKQLPQAVEAYVRLNGLAMRRVTAGGFLATASCSQHVDRDEFRQILSRASYVSGRRVRLVQWGGQAKDHPVRLSMPETEYLKFALVQVS
jgi:23S rRNA (cytosine1962-C5)-methyltransferase